METVDKREEKLLKEILNGKYRDFYLVYNRKSTDEPDNQKNSIAYQTAENSRFSYKEKLQIAPLTLKSLCVNGVISEKHSGFKEDNDITFTKDGLVQYRIDRPKFQRLAQFLSQGLFKGIVCLCWDRISRNKADDTLIRKLMRKGIDVRFTYAKYEKTSSGALHMDIDGMFAEHHSRVTSEKVTINIRNLREQGVCTYRAPIGYLNKGTMDKKPLDPKRAPIIKRMFELYATGDWALSDISKWAHKEGLTTVPMRRRRTEEEMLAEEDDEIKIKRVSRAITINIIHRILTNKFYTGKILGNRGEYVKSVSHKELVNEEIFNKVQEVLKSKKVSVRYANKLYFQYRGKIRCFECKRVYTPYKRKGIQYFNARCQKQCNNPLKNFNIKSLKDDLSKKILSLSFSDDEVAEINASIITDVSIFEEKRHKQLEQYERRKKAIREDLTYLRTNKLLLLKAGTYSPEAYIEEEKKLITEIEFIQDEERTSDISMHEVIEDISKLSELLKDVYLHYSLADSAEQEEIISLIFSELYISENRLIYKCKNGFQALESRFVALGGLNAWLSELLSYSHLIKDSLAEIKQTSK